MYWKQRTCPGFTSIQENIGPGVTSIIIITGDNSMQLSALVIVCEFMSVLKYRIPASTAPYKSRTGYVATDQNAT